MKHLRTMAAPFVVAAPTGARIRTRLRLDSGDDTVLREVGGYLGSLAGADLAARCRLGSGPKHAGRAARKKALTARSSSRWAGTITRLSADQWERGHSNLTAEGAGLRAAVRVIESRLAAPVGAKAGRVRGYATPSERAQKQRRLQVLQVRLRAVEGRLVGGRVSVVRGGARLARARHHLGAAGLSTEEWSSLWRAARLFLRADGEADKAWGNETIRVHPEDAWLEIRLPTPLAHLSNTPGRAPTYRLSCSVTFNHRADEWAAQAATGAVAYDISHDPVKARWYLDASWTTTRASSPSLAAVQAQPTLGVDLNADHLACWVIDSAGNPVGAPLSIPLSFTGAASRRDGRLRAAITTLIDHARANDCASVTIEDLGFTDARQVGRETMGRGRRGKRFRRTVAAIPTAKLKARLLSMAHNRGIAVIAVDPAYTSRWGGQHWQGALQQQTPTSTAVSRHLAAAVVIGRRGHGHRARRRPEKTGADRRICTGEPSARPCTTPVTSRNPDSCKDPPLRHQTRNTDRPDQDRWGNQAPQHRSGAPVNRTSAAVDTR